MSAVSSSGDETEKALFVQTNSDNDQSPSFATIRFGTLPAAVEQDSPSSAVIKIYAAPEGQLDLIDNLTMPHPARADFETTGTLDPGQIAFAEFKILADHFASVTAMSWKETVGSEGTVTNIDTRVSYLQIVDASTETDTLSLQIPVENQCPDRKNEPPESEWPCVIDDIPDTEDGSWPAATPSHLRRPAGRSSVWISPHAPPNRPNQGEPAPCRRSRIPTRHVPTGRCPAVTL